MRLPFIVLSVLLHMAVLTCLLLGSPSPITPITQVKTPDTTPAHILTEAVAITDQNNPNALEVRNTTIQATTAAQSDNTTPHLTSAPNVAHDVGRDQHNTPDTPPSTAAAHLNSTAQPSVTTPVTSAVTSATTLSASAASKHDNIAPTPHNEADTSPLKNKPLTKQLTCTPTAKRQGIVGQVMLHVQISADGVVQTAQINGGSQDSTMNQLAHEQAMRLKFPTVRNAAGTAVASYSDVKLTFDCGSD